MKRPRVRTLAVGTIVVGGLLLSVAHVRAVAGTAEFSALRAAMASGGGGVVFVRNPEDCSATVGPVEFVAARLDSLGVEVRGVVLRRGRVREAVRLAGRAFPHGPISPLATTPLFRLGYRRTPLAMVVDAAGTVVKVEAFDGRPAAVILKSLTAQLGVAG